MITQRDLDILTVLRDKYIRELLDKFNKAYLGDRAEYKEANNAEPTASENGAETPNQA